MPAMLEDPAAAPRYRTSGVLPLPDPARPSIPSNIQPHQVTLRDRTTVATLLPFATSNDVPARLLSYLCNQFNLEIEKGDTYPMTETMTLAFFASYWFQNFGAVMLVGDFVNIEQVVRIDEEGAPWEELCLGSFYVKPNYPGRSSHVCNGGFLVTEAARNKGVGRLMGESYLDWAPKLGYSYSVFNLVYETNLASCRIWDALGFKRIGRVKGCGNLRSSPDELVDAIIYGRDLGSEGDEYLWEERFDKIRFYLKHGKYPNGADRAEKSRLRSAAMHYKLIAADEENTEVEKLMLKDKEVVSDPQRQYQIARQIHAQSHGGINKTTACIAERYHWIRIKETVSQAIKNCTKCKESNSKPAPVRSSTFTIPAPQISNHITADIRPPNPREASSLPDSSQLLAAHFNPFTTSNTHLSDVNISSTRPVISPVFQYSHQTAQAQSQHFNLQSQHRHQNHHTSNVQLRHVPSAHQPTSTSIAGLRTIENYVNLPLDPRLLQNQNLDNSTISGVVSDSVQMPNFSSSVTLDSMLGTLQQSSSMPSSLTSASMARPSTSDHRILQEHPHQHARPQKQNQQVRLTNSTAAEELGPTGTYSHNTDMGLDTNSKLPENPNADMSLITSIAPHQTTDHDQQMTFEPGDVDIVQHTGGLGLDTAVHFEMDEQD